jgi:hypothetical protein
MAAPIYETRFVTPDNFPEPAVGAPALAELHSGDVLCAFSVPPGGARKGTAIHVSRLTGGDYHWTHPSLVETLPTSDVTDFAFFVSSYGTVFLLWMATANGQPCIKAKASAERGHSWHTPEIIPAHAGWELRNPPVQLADEDVLLPVYDAKTSASLVLGSDDVARTWFQRGAIPANEEAEIPGLAVLPNGHVVALVGPGDDPNGAIWRTISKDGGRGWQEPKQTALTAGAPISVTTLITGGILAAVPGAGGALSLALSTDAGQNWRVRRELEPAVEEHQWYPYVLQTSDGMIHVAYRTPENRIKQAVVNEEWVRGER